MKIKNFSHIEKNLQSNIPPLYVINELIELRYLYNINNECDKGKHIKELLNSKRIFINDKLRLWYCVKSGRYGELKGHLPIYSHKYVSNYNISLIAKIEQSIFLRMRYRFVHKWKDADIVRDQLNKLNVKINDSTNSWWLKGTLIEGSCKLINWKFV
jgi:hypothetical protein